MALATRLCWWLLRLDSSCWLDFHGIWQRMPYAQNRGCHGWPLIRFAHCYFFVRTGSNWAVEVFVLCSYLDGQSKMQVVALWHVRLWSTRIDKFWSMECVALMPTVAQSLLVIVLIPRVCSQAKHWNNTKAEHLCLFSIESYIHRHKTPWRVQCILQCENWSYCLMTSYSS